jgi:hypothetical protein
MSEDLDILPDKPYLLSDEDWEFVNSKRRRQVLRIAAAQWWLCYYCILPIDETYLSRDHLIPKSKGGRGVSGNIVATCPGCNLKKGSRDAPPDAYIRGRRLQHYRQLGLWCTKPRGKWGKIYPGFGVDLDGKPLLAPQFGIF